MAQHVTTLNEIREGMDPTDTPSNTDLIYAERGTGSDRARAFQVDEIAAKATETLGDGGDIAFSSYQAAGGVTRTKGDIQDGKILGRMFAALVDLISKVLCWYNVGFGTTDIGYDGLRFWGNDYNPANPSGTPNYKFDNEGVVKMNKLVFNTTFGAQVRNGRTNDDYATMTSCEAKAGASVKPTEYLTAVYVTSGVGNDKFTLDSTKHELGAVVLVTNTGESAGGTSMNPLRVFAAADTGFANALCEIPIYHSKMFRYCGTTQGTNYPVWLPVA